MFTLPGFWVPFVHWLWRVPTILYSAGVVSHELEDLTWNTLRATTLSVYEIVMAKYAAVIRRMEPHYMLVIYVRAVPVVIFGVSWIVSTLTVLPQQGFYYWISTSLAFVFAGAYLLLSPALDVAFDAALGVMTSAFSGKRSTSLIMATLARLAGWMLPFALVVPLQYGVLNNMAQLDMVSFRAITTVATFGPAYAFLWGVDAWLSVIVVATYTAVRVGLIRLMLAVAVNRAERIEI